MTAPPQVNGHKSPATPIVLGEWRPIETTGNATVWEKPTPVQEQTEVPPTPQPTVPAVDHVALAEAEAIRKRADAEAEATRIKAESEAAARIAKAEAEAEKLRLANERAAMAAEEKRAVHEARMAEVNRQREETERQTAEARKAEEAQQEEADAAAKEIAKADDKWRKYAIRFAVVCGIVALPVQMSAFWNPAAWWLVAAPVMLEGGSWVVQKGAASAVANRRPLWHYRVIAWLLALIAAGINLWHGWNAFDPATAIATAFASVAGPGVWDLHEHGRIRKRDGVLSRRERKAQEAATKKAAKEKSAREATVRAEKDAAEKAAVEAAAQLAADRERDYEDEWKYAVKLASAMGETSVTEKVWERAFDVMHASKPSETAAEIRLRNAALRRVEAARSEAPGNKPIKVTNGQRASQMPPTSKVRRYAPPAVSGIRRKGDTPKYISAARAQAAITAKQSVRANITAAN